jgi:hypothetical protein
MAPYLPFGGLCCWSSGITFLSLSGILSSPWSPLASLPPELEVPLPLRLGFTELPVVGAVPGVAELAAGSPLTAPRPLAPPDCAKAVPEQSTIAATTAGFMTFMGKSLRCGIKAGGRLWFLDSGVGSGGRLTPRFFDYRPERLLAGRVIALGLRSVSSICCGIMLRA